MVLGSSITWARKAFWKVWGEGMMLEILGLNHLGEGGILEARGGDGLAPVLELLAREAVEEVKLRSRQLRQTIGAFFYGPSQGGRIKPFLRWLTPPCGG